MVCLCLESHLLASWNVRYLPKDIGQQYYGNKSAFTFLRDPQLSLADIGPVRLLGNRELSLTRDLTHKNPCLHVRYDRAVNDFRSQAPLLDAVCAHNRPLFCDFAWSTTIFYIFLLLQTTDYRMSKPFFLVYSTNQWLDDRSMAWIRFLPSAAGKTRHGGKIDWIAKAKNIRPGAPSLRFDAIISLNTNMA